jgi:hypothetical protein
LRPGAERGPASRPPDHELDGPAIGSESPGSGTFREDTYPCPDPPTAAPTPRFRRERISASETSSSRPAARPSPRAATPAAASGIPRAQATAQADRTQKAARDRTGSRLVRASSSAKERRDTSRPIPRSGPRLPRQGATRADSRHLRP